MSDPAVEAVERVAEICQQGKLGIYLEFKAPITSEHAAAREALRPIRDQMVAAHARYSELQESMLAATTSAETSRYANEMAGIHYLYRLIAPLVYSTEELA